MESIERAHAPRHGDSGGLQTLATALRRIGSYIQSLHERIRLLDAVIDNFPGGISLFDSNLKMVLCNDQQKKMLEYPENLFVGEVPILEDLFRFNASRGEYGPGEVEEHVSRRMALVRERKPHVFERTRPNGMVLEIRGTPLKGGGFVTTYLDVTAQRRSQALIAHLAHHDTLTNLPNRALFADRLQTAIALAKRSGMVAVHYLDIDGFKVVNDVLGHDVGDALLVAIAGRLHRSVRENDTVARLGGDEFAIIQTGFDKVSDAAVLAGRVVRDISRPFDLLGNDVRVGASIGIAVVPQDGIEIDEVVRKADRALYRSKSNGRGRFSFYE